MICIIKDKNGNPKDQFTKLLLDEYTEIFGGDRRLAESIICANNGYPLEQTPDGKPSLLFGELLSLFGDKDLAIILKAKVYSPQFCKWFGNWVGLQNKDGIINYGKISKAVDKNGEPLAIYYKKQIVIDGRDKDADVQLDQIRSINTLDDAISLLELNSVFKYVAKLMRKAFHNSVNVQFLVLQLDVKTDEDGSVHVTGGNITIEDNKYIITINSLSRHPLKSLAHELVHLFTLSKLRSDSNFAKTTKKIYNAYKDLASQELRLQYGFSSVEEFVAEFYTNEQFRESLKSIEAIPDRLFDTYIPAGRFKLLKSMFHQIIMFVSNLLNKTNIDRTYRLLNELFSDEIIDNGLYDEIDTYYAQKAKDSNKSLIAQVRGRIHDEYAKKLRDSLRIAQFKNIKEQLDDLNNMLNGYSVAHSVSSEKEKNDVNKWVLAFKSYADIMASDLLDLDRQLNELRLSNSSLSSDNLLFQYRSVIEMHKKAIENLKHMAPQSTAMSLRDKLILNLAQETIKSCKHMLDGEYDLYNNSDGTGLINKIEDMMDDMCQRFITDWVDKYAYALDEELRNNIIKAMSDILHGYIEGGVINSIEQFAGNAATSRSPFINMLWQLVNESGKKSNLKIDKKGLEFLKKFRKAFGNDINLKNHMLLFCETDEMGKTTGYFIRDINYGLYLRDLKKFKEDLLKDSHFKKYYKEDIDEDTGKVVIVWGEKDPATGLFRYTKSAKQAEMDYNDEIDYWIGGCEKSILGKKYVARQHRRFKPEYYILRRHFLTKETIDRIARLERSMTAIKSMAVDKKTGIFYRYKLTKRQNDELVRLEREKRELANFYKTVNGKLVKKQEGSVEYEIAKSLYNWYQFLQEKVDGKQKIKYQSNDEKFSEDFKKLVIELGGSDKLAEYIINLYTVSKKKFELFLEEHAAIKSAIENVSSYEELYKMCKNEGADDKLASNIVARTFLDNHPDVKSFLNDNTYKVISDQWRDEFNESLVHKSYDETDQANLNLLYYKYRKILLKCYSKVGAYENPDLSLLTGNTKEDFDRYMRTGNPDTDWAMLADIDQQIASIKSSQYSPDETSNFDEYATRVYAKNTRTGKTYVSEHGEKDMVYMYDIGNGHERPLRAYSYTAPNSSMLHGKSTIEYNKPSGQYSMINVDESYYANPLYVQKTVLYNNPILEDSEDNELNGTFEVGETSILLNTKDFPQYINKAYKELYENRNGSKKNEWELYKFMLNTMWEALSMYGMSSESRSYRLPQMHGELASLLFNRGLENPMERFSATWNSIVRGTIGDELDTEFSRKSIHANGKEGGSVRRRYINMISDPEHISTDLLFSIMSYYTCACHYEDKSDIAPMCEMMVSVVENSINDEDVKNSNVALARLIIDTYLYDIRSLASKKSTKAVVKVGKKIAQLTTLTMLSHNFRSWVKGGIDAHRQLTEYALVGHYLEPSAIEWVTLQLMKEVGRNTANLGDAKNYTLSEGLMLLFELGDSMDLAFKDTNKTRATRIIKKHAGMGEFTMIDHAVVKKIMYSQLHRYRLLVNPIPQINGGKHEVIDFMNRDEFRSWFKKHAKSILSSEEFNKVRQEGWNLEAYVLSKADKAYDDATLMFDAFELNEEEGYAGIKEQYRDLLLDKNGKFKPCVYKIISGTQKLSALCNGYAPEGSKHGHIFRKAWLNALVTTRSYILSLVNEQAKSSKALAKKDEKGNVIKGDKNRHLIFDVDSATVDVSQWIGLYKTIIHFLPTIYNAYHSFINKHVREDYKRKENGARPQDVQGAMKIFMDVLSVVLVVLIARVLIGFAGLALASDDDDSLYDINLGKWSIMQATNIAIAESVEFSTQFNPATISDLTKTPSTWIPYLERSANILNWASLSYSLAVAEALGGDESDNEHSYNDIIKRGAYKGHSYGFRSFMKGVSMFGIPADNIYRSYDTDAINATIEYTMRNQAPANWGWVFKETPQLVAKNIKNQ